MGRIVFVIVTAIAMVVPGMCRSEMTSANFQLDAEPIGVSGRWVESAQFNLYSTIGMPPVVFVSLISTPGGYSLWNGVDTSLVYLALAPSNADVTVVSLMQGWNLVGNSSVGSLDVVSQLGDASRVTTVWKWNASQSKWAFYAPSMTGQALTDYAASKGYDVLSTIDSGEGYWVNSKIGFTAPLPAGSAIASASFQTMGAGWNLIGYPSAASRNLPDALSDHGVGTDFSLVYAYRAADTADPWKLYDRNAPHWSNDLSALSPDGGYWVQVSVTHTLTVAYPAP